MWGVNINENIIKYELLSEVYLYEYRIFREIKTKLDVLLLVYGTNR